MSLTALVILVSILFLFLVGTLALITMKLAALNKQLVQQSLEEKKDLLNRLMSKDPQTYSMMTALTSGYQLSNSEGSQSFDDNSELARARMAAGHPASIAEGPGPLDDGMADEDFVEMLADMDLPSGDRY